MFSCRGRWALVLLSAWLAGCPSSSFRDAEVSDLSSDADQSLSNEAGPHPTDGGVSREAAVPDRPNCTPPIPPKANYVDTCKLSHRPWDKTNLSNKTPAGTEPVTVRLETQAGDVQKVTLRLWSGVLRELPMTVESSSGGIDRYRAVVPPSARPIYYRFRVEDGSAVLWVTARGAKQSPTAADDFWIAPVAPGKTVHYPTDFTQPEIMWRSSPGGTHQKQAMVGELAGRAGVTGVGVSSGELFFYFRDAKTGVEDHPPGGGDYRMAPDLFEAWVQQGTVFDVEPSTLSIGLVDSHTHPYGNGFVYDPNPLITLLPPQGIDRALTMVTGSSYAQKTALKALRAANRWITPLVWVDPLVHTVAEVEDLLKNHGFKGLKFHPVVFSYPADGSAMDPFLDLAEKYRVPVQIHSATDDTAKPWRIVALAKRHPAVAVVMIHTELGTIDKTNTLSVIKPQPNVYAETSWVNPESILQAMSTLDSSRTLFGTDSTVDAYQQFTKQSIANPQGQYVYTIPAVMAAVKSKANPAAYANWARLNAIRLYDLRFRPDPDLLDTDGDGIPDVSDPDPDNDGKSGAADPAPLDPSH